MCLNNRGSSEVWPGCYCNECMKDRTKPVTKCTCGHLGALCAKCATPAIDWSKPVQTVKGVSVRILSTKGPGQYPILGVEGQENWVRMWQKDGAPGYGDHNLVQAPVVLTQRVTFLTPAGYRYLDVVLDDAYRFIRATEFRGP